MLLWSCTPTTVTSSKNTAAPESNEPVEQAGSDILAGDAWHLNNTGQRSFAGANGTSGEDLNINDVINMGFRGTGIKIAVSDTGVDLSHPDLNDNGLDGYHRDYSSADPSAWQAADADPYPLELDGHGTAVTGLASAEGWNTIGSRGVAPGAKFGGFLFIGDWGDDATSYETKVLDQLLGDFDIFNYSYGYPGCSFTPVEDSIVDGYKQGVTFLRGGRGAVYVKSAGNDFVGYNDKCDILDDSFYLGNTNTNEDQNIPYVIVTAAVNALGEVSSYSTPGSGLWISSAGGELGLTTGSNRGPAMISTDILGCADGLSNSLSDTNFNKGLNVLNSSCDYTSQMNGTSAAAPTLSGIVALMLDANPSLTWRDVKHILATTAQKINYSTGALTHPLEEDLDNHTYDFLYVRNAANYDFSNTYGFGRVDAKAAVELALGYSSGLGSYVETLDPNTDGWYYSSGAVVAVPDEDATGGSSTITVRHNLSIESVQISFSTDHPLISDLGVELVSPSGTRSKLLVVNSNIKENTLTGFLMLSNAFYGEKSRGLWRLNVIDGKATNTGNISGWSIKINGHNVSTSDITAPNPPTLLVHSATDLSLTDSPPVTFTASSSLDVMRYEVAIGSSPTGEEQTEWFSIGTATGFTITDMTLTADDVYYIRVRAIDTSENVSSVLIGNWTAGQ